MYICKPERNVRQAQILLTLSALITALLFLLSTLIEQYASLVRLMGYLALVISIWLNVRYSLTEYEYVVGGGDFSVVKTVGNRRQTICNVSLETAVDLIEKRDYDHLPAAQKAIIKYSLNQNIKAVSYVFLCNFNGKLAMIEFEPNPEFVSILKNEIKLAKHSSEDAN